jgi:hypothetical protein
MTLVFSNSKPDAPGHPSSFRLHPFALSASLSAAMNGPSLGGLASRVAVMPNFLSASEATGTMEATRVPLETRLQLRGLAQALGKGEEIVDLGRVGDRDCVDFAAFQRLHQPDERLRVRGQSPAVGGDLDHFRFLDPQRFSSSMFATP